MHVYQRVLTLIFSLCLFACQEKHLEGQGSLQQIEKKHQRENRFNHCHRDVARQLDAYQDAPDSRLILSSLGIDEYCLASLSPWLQQHREWRELDLSNNKINDQALVDLLLVLDGSVVHSLILAGNLITDAVTSALSGYLNHHSNLVQLDLSGNAINDRGVCIVAHGLRHRAALISFNLGNTNMGQKGMSCLVTLLSEQKWPKEMILDNNDLSIWQGRVDQNVSTIASDVVSCQNCNLSENALMGMMALANHLPGLTRLNLSGNETIDPYIDDLLDNLVMHPGLRELDLRFSAISDEAEAALLSKSQNNPLMNIRY